MLSVVKLVARNDPFMLSCVILGVANEPFMLSVIVLNVDMLSVVAQDPSVVLNIGLG
jgi:hypothetical protein